jgi:uncharacterized membrane protein
MLIGTAIHILAAAILIGGTFFMVVVLSPGVRPLELATRLALWERTLSGFLMWVWISLAALFASGIAMAISGFGGFSALGGYVRLMAALAALITLIFAYLQFVPLKRFRRAIAKAELTAATGDLGRVRLVLTVNLVLGIITAVIGATRGS